MSTKKVNLLVKLDCRHYVKVDFEIDLHLGEHYILCPSCRFLKLDDYGRVPTAWRPVLSIDRRPDALRNVSKRDANLVSRGDVLVLRGRPFPYIIHQRDSTKRGFTFR